MATTWGSICPFRGRTNIRNPPSWSPFAQLARSIASRRTKVSQSIVPNLRLSRLGPPVPQSFFQSKLARIITLNAMEYQVISCGFMWRFPKMGVPQIIQVMNDHDLVLKPMVTWGSPMTKETLMSLVAFDLGSSRHAASSDRWDRTSQT